MAQIDAHQFALAAQIFDDPKTIPEIVGDEQRVAVRSYRDSRRIDRRAIAVVSR